MFEKGFYTSEIRKVNIFAPVKAAHCGEEEGKKCTVLMKRAQCSLNGPPCHLKELAVRLTERLCCTSAIPVCLSVSFDFCLDLHPSITASPRQRAAMLAHSLKPLLIPFVNYLLVWYTCLPLSMFAK